MTRAELSTVRLYDPLEANLPFDERQGAEVAAIDLQQIERTEEGPLAVEQQLVEVGSTVYIGAGDLSIENRGVAPNGVREFDFEVGPLLEGVAGA